MPVELEVAFLAGHGVESGGSSDGEEQCAENDGTFALEFDGGEGSDQVGRDADGPGNHVEQNGLVVVVTETTDDERSKSRDTAGNKGHAEDYR